MNITNPDPMSCTPMSCNTDDSPPPYATHPERRVRGAGLPADVRRALRTGRRARGWSYRKAEAATSVSFSHLRSLEVGLWRPSVVVAELLIEHYRLDGAVAARLLERSAADAGRSHPLFGQPYRRSRHKQRGAS